MPVRVRTPYGSGAHTLSANLTPASDSEQMSIQFYDTPRRAKRAFEPLNSDRVRMYSCGPTVWDFSHIGNFRCFLFYDVLKRYLQYRGFAVEHVMNLTDVDDRIVSQVNAQKTTLEAYVQTYIDGFFADIDALGIARADNYPRATQHIPEMIDLIRRLVDKGVAYERDGSVYFAISGFPTYGDFAHLDTSGMRVGGRVDTDKYDKDDVRDFVLWKAWIEEDGDLAWDSPWGRGRPGWHLECSCMSMKYLGETFDIHTGGVDLVFPHHQNEIAQSEGATGKQFARYWMHNEFINIDGVGMSKSLGNNLRLRDIREGDDADRARDDVAGFRYFVVTNHYRTTLNFSREALDGAINARQRLNKLYTRLRHLVASESVQTGQSDVEADSWPTDIATARTGFVEAMDDDLNAPKAMAAVFGLVGSAGRALSAATLPQAAAALVCTFLEEVDAVLGVLDEEGQGTDETEVNPELPEPLAQMLRDREHARASKEWARSDELRDILVASGVAITDTPDGPTWTWTAPEPS
jgi:cysteinyl-tRNA synthetase